MNIQYICAILLLRGIQIVLCDDRFLKKELFSTKTPYFWSRDVNENIPENDAVVTTDHGQTCNAIYVDGILRHGARYPSLQWIQWMNKLHSRLRGKEVKFIDDWVNIFHESKQNAISALGKLEQFYLGKRFGTRFLKLLQNSNIEYFTTDKQRCIDSASEFYRGMRDVGVTTVPTMNFTTDNIMLRFWEHCKRYIDSVQTNKTALSEYSKFMDGPEMTAVVNSVSQNIGNGSVTISPFDVVVMQQICAFELAFNNKSDWCQLFTESDLEVIDYMDDIDEFWKTAFGYKINSEMSCPLVSAVFGNMDQALLKFPVKATYTKAAFRFTHSEVISSLFTALDLFKESTPLLASNFNVHKFRSFRTSNTLPMSANIAFVLYHCGTDLHDVRNYWVKVLVNEREVVIPECGERMCWYSSVRGRLYDLIEKCNFEQLCAVTGSSSGGECRYVSTYFYVALLICSLVFRKLPTFV